MKNTIRKAADTYGAYILDMDGTLYHQLPVRFCMALSLAAYYIHHLNLLNELSEIQRFRADIENGVIKEPYGAIKYWMEEAPLKYIKTFRNKKLISFIELQKRRGALIAVYSDHPAKEKCCVLNFEADYIFCSRDKEINCIKPDSHGLKYIVELLNLNVKEILYIGDRYKKDGLCAKALGMDYLQAGSV